MYAIDHIAHFEHRRPPRTVRPARQRAWTRTDPGTTDAATGDEPSHADATAARWSTMEFAD